MEKKRRPLRIRRRERDEINFHGGRWRGRVRRRDGAKYDGGNACNFFGIIRNKGKTRERKRGGQRTRGRAVIQMCGGGKERNERKSQEGNSLGRSLV